MPLNAWDRLQADDHLIDLIAQGIRLRHPQAVKMTRIGLADLERLTDEQILAATARLQAWIDNESMVAGRVGGAVALTGGPARTPKAGS